MQTNGVSIAAIICAAGSSSRMGGIKKEYLPLPPGAAPPEGDSLTVLGAALNAFASCPQIDPIVISVPAGTDDEKNAALASIPKELQSEAESSSAGLSPGEKRKRILFVPGGLTRRASVYNALLRLEPYHPSHVLIHDGARPWIKRELIERIIDAALRYGAVIPALPLTETPKELGDSAKPGEEPEFTGAKFITRHLRRRELCTAQTPQGFRYPDILRAHEKAAEREAKEHFEYTDDAEIWGEFAGSLGFRGQVAVISGESENRKITYPEDLDNFARPVSEQTNGGEKEKLMQRIGLGRDLHRLETGRRFLLGGVEIPFEKGELGHSDGDVLAHAVIDALLGAAALGDIGELYPSGDPAWKDADSLKLLKSAWDKVRNEGWRLVNLDCTVSCENPKILPYRESIRRSLSQTLGVDTNSVFVKGKTNEGLGPLGTGEAVEALAICLLAKQ